MSTRSHFPEDGILYLFDDAVSSSGFSDRGSSRGLISGTKLRFYLEGTEEKYEEPRTA
jgi:hypothetical protein